MGIGALVGIIAVILNLLFNIVYKNIGGSTIVPKIQKSYGHHYTKKVFSWSILNVVHLPIYHATLYEILM
jgi:hypothetical protein